MNAPSPDWPVHRVNRAGVTRVLSGAESPCPLPRWPAAAAAPADQLLERDERGRFRAGS
jgi:hypothetical protein